MGELSGQELKALLEERWRDRGLISSTNRATWSWRFSDPVTGEPVLGAYPGSRIVKPVKRPRRNFK